MPRKPGIGKRCAGGSARFPNFAGAERPEVCHVTNFMFSKFFKRRDSAEAPAQVAIAPTPKPAHRNSKPAAPHQPRPARQARQHAPAPADPVRETKEGDPQPFLELGLAEPVARGAAASGYSEPTPIQKGAIPIVLTGKDLMGSAQTGTGKTAAFALPILSRLDKNQRGNPRVLILEPTRELAMQVDEAFRDFARFTDLRAAAFYGGVGYGKQRDEIKRGVDVVIATPGRLLDYLQQREISLKNVRRATNARRCSSVRRCRPRSSVSRNGRSGPTRRSSRSASAVPRRKPSRTPFIR